MSRKESSKGPFVYENWRAFRNGKKPKAMLEFPIFSDVERIVGEEISKYRPYSFLNPVPIDTIRGDFCPVLYVRFEEFLESSVPAFRQTQTEAFHGGLIFDEIAALISLALGIRAKAGDISYIPHEGEGEFRQLFPTPFYLSPIGGGVHFQKLEQFLLQRC